MILFKERLMGSTATVGELVVERPSRARLFERLGIDYCCGGKVTLAHTCAKQGLDLEQVTQELQKEQQTAAPAGVDWATAPLSQLADHIEQTHHAYLKAELPRLNMLTEKVARVHGGRHQELVNLRHIFVGLKAEMEMHMMKEERILFPMCRDMEQSSGPVSFHCGSVSNPIAVMVREHEDAGDALAQMRQLTAGYTPPADACNTYRVMLAALAELEQDMHTHVHKENNILFPRAAAMEERLNGA